MTAILLDEEVLGLLYNSLTDVALPSSDKERFSDIVLTCGLLTPFVLGIIAQLLVFLERKKLKNLPWNQIEEDKVT